jgi:hypothetical protein
MIARASAEDISCFSICIPVVLGDGGAFMDAPGCTERAAEPGAGDEERSGGVVGM